MWLGVAVAAGLVSVIGGYLAVQWIAGSEEGSQESMEAQAEPANPNQTPAKSAGDNAERNAVPSAVDSPKDQAAARTLHLLRSGSPALRRTPIQHRQKRPWSLFRSHQQPSLSPADPDARGAVEPTIEPDSGAEPADSGTVAPIAEPGHRRLPRLREKSLRRPRARKCTWTELCWGHPLFSCQAQQTSIGSRLSCPVTSSTWPNCLPAVRSRFPEEVTPSAGPAGIKVKCRTKNRYYVFVDGQDVGQLCPTERIGVRLGQHVVEIYDPVTDTRERYDVNVKETRLSLRVRVD